MRTILLLSAAAAAATAASPAFAQAGAPFTGLRVEGVAGYDSLGNGHDQASSTSSGVLYGAQVGYDIQAGPVVAGIEGEITGSTADTRTDNLVSPGDRFRVDAGRDLYVGGRVGYVISPLAMIYGKAGYTNARVEERYDDGINYYRDHQDLGGYRLGVGIEYNISPAYYVKGEYRYSHYGRIDDGYTSYDIDADRNQVIAGVGLRF